MNIQQNTRGLVEAALLVAITCIFVVIGTYIPFLSFLLFFIPVPFIILGKRHNIRFVVLSVIASGIIISSFSNPIYALVSVAFPGVGAIVMAYMMKKEYNPKHIVLGGAAANIITILITFTIIAKIFGVSLSENISLMFERAGDMQYQIYQAAGFGQEKIDILKETMENWATLASMIIPASIILISVFSSYINYIVATQILTRIGYKVDTFTKFRYLKLPRNIFYGTFIILALTYIVKYFNIVNHQALMMNIVLLFQVVFLVQGLAVLVDYMLFYNIKKPFRALIIIFLILSRGGVFILSVVGFADCIIDFRKYKRRKE